MEIAFQDFVRGHKLPPPDLNQTIEGHEVDCVWRYPNRLIVELDGGAAHTTTHAFHADRAKDRALQAAGWPVFRVTWHHLLNEQGDLHTHVCHFVS